MPRARWGISAEDVDNFDRDSQYAPYTGPQPQDGTYQFKIKLAKFISGTREKQPQLRVGLELVPRNREEKKYAGYFTMAFMPVMDKTAFRYVPFLDAIGVTGKEFELRTIVDEEGNIQRIGAWNNNGKTLILAQLRTGADATGNPRQEPNWFGALGDEPNDSDDDDDSDDYDDSDVDYVDDVDESDDDDSDEYDDEEEEPEPPRRARKAAAPTRLAAPVRKAAPRRRSTRDEDGF